MQYLANPTCRKSAASFTSSCDTSPKFDDSSTDTCQRLSVQDWMDEQQSVVPRREASRGSEYFSERLFRCYELGTRISLLSNASMTVHSPAKARHQRARLLGICLPSYLKAKTVEFDDGWLVRSQGVRLSNFEKLLAFLFDLLFKPHPPLRPRQILVVFGDSRTSL